ncbi:YihY/virulence factor BrkB family protein [Halorussus limi]|uniref:YihY/virulence factor BrkB family protein n=1 Tax=Halorussus limi TaxID=2938695 RepID=A0A8U0HSL1_9EURY|nr:YihY/virulence factor BrkB family protein [Halorussus limi]UPV74102.1 YihY/virulence factor BrkB family protein [Halorussus limi]
MELPAMRGVGKYGEIGKGVLAVAREEHLSVTAAGLAYYMFLSAIPLLLFGFIGFSALDGIGSLVLAVELATDDSVARFFEQSIRDDASRTRAAVIAAVLVVWSALRMFATLRRIFADLYSVRKQKSVFDRVMTVGLGFGVVTLALVLLVALGVARSIVFTSTAWTVLGPLLLFGGLSVVFFPLYYVFPSETSPREALPGTVFAAASWTVSSGVFRWYAGLSESVRLYGIVGGVLLLLAWLYVAALVVLLGIVLNAVLDGRVTPDYDWLPSVLSDAKAD